MPRTPRTPRAIFAVAACFLSLSLAAQAQLAPRIAGPISNATRVRLAGSLLPIARPEADLGPVPADMKLPGISLVFNRTPAQQTALDALVAAQQNPASPLYHRWLTPDEFAARFGMADQDIAAVSAWLQLQGFSIDAVSRSRNRIVFSGTAALVAAAFHAPLHVYGSTVGSHFAPSAELELPAAFASSVQAVTNLSNLRPRAHIKPGKPQPSFTSGLSGNHYMSPGDLATIYDITPAYSAGFTGVNQTIAILGQSAVSLSDITLFQAAAGVAAKTPQPILVPTSGLSTVYADGDEAESDLDLEYSSTIAKGAQVLFVYTGSTSTYGVFDSLRYAVDERISPIISISYGDCETDFGLSNYTTFNAVLQQAAAQGQTVVSASGDDGSTDCYGINDPNNPLTTAQLQALAVDFPSDSQYVTAVGGTEFSTAAVAAGNNTYFTPQGSSDTISSALSYIPEIAWNDDVVGAVGASATSDPLASGGGGISTFTSRPSWQTGTIGGVAIPSGTFRLMPDVSLNSSPYNAPYLYCSSDTSFWGQGQLSSCSSGFRDSSTGDVTIAGGTSFAAPIFAGMLAIINQSINSTGEGVVNPTLYTLAAVPATYAAAFHDVTSGGNQCLAGAPFCAASGESEYPAGTGYDEATGLGSVDLYKLLTAWPQPAVATLAGTTTTLSPATTTPVSGAADIITITVAQTSTLAPAVGTPTGTVTLTIDGAAPTAATTLTLVNGVATYTFSSKVSGSHIVVATYSGDTVYAPSTTTLDISITAATVGSFTVSATNVTVASGSSGTTTATITPAGGYTGTVEFGLTSAVALPDACISGSSSATVSGTTAVTTVFTIYTNLDTCNTLANGALRSHQRFYRLSSPAAGRAANTPPGPSRRLPLSIALAGVLLLFGGSRFGRKRAARDVFRAAISLGVLLTLATAGFGLTACSSSATSTETLNNVTPGTYVLTLTATDPITNQTASSNFNLVVQ